MEKTENKIIKSTRIVHKFYCDKCGKYLGESEELSDGYYKEYGEYYIDFHIPKDDMWYVSKGYLCEKCKNAYFISVKNLLLANGFVGKNLMGVR